ncbi:MAG: hypothetical protein M1834_006119 [Cirrosporium novae-zelandiae]|nr:MAG: hypothetical protein M1834_006119 [Cirrosporium novae-zelandiae]
MPRRGGVQKMPVVQGRVHTDEAGNLKFVHGDGTEDIAPRTIAQELHGTAFHPDQIIWGPARQNRPSILFQWKKGTRQDPNYNVQLMHHSGRLVLDLDSQPIWDFVNLNFTLSNGAEEFRIEAIIRQDPRIGLRDIRARMMPSVNGEDNRPSQHAIQQGMLRWRRRTRCLAWQHHGTSGRFEEAIADDMTDAMKAANSTREFHDLTRAQVKALEARGNGSCPNRRRKAKRGIEQVVEDTAEPRGATDKPPQRRAKRRKLAMERQDNTAISFATEGPSIENRNSRLAPPSYGPAYELSTKNATSHHNQTPAITGSFDGTHTAPENWVLTSPYSTYSKAWLKASVTSRKVQSHTPSNQHNMISQPQQVHTSQVTNQQAQIDNSIAALSDYNTRPQNGTNGAQTSNQHSQAHNLGTTNSLSTKREEDFASYLASHPSPTGHNARGQCSAPNDLQKLRHDLSRIGYHN